MRKWTNGKISKYLIFFLKGKKHEDFPEPKGYHMSLVGGGFSLFVKLRERLRPSLIYLFFLKKKVLLNITRFLYTRDVCEIYIEVI